MFKAACRAGQTLRRPHERIEAVPQSSRIDVAALGELVVDLIPARAADGSACLAPKPGGAPGNVAVGVARLGGRAAMLSKVGDDAFGRLLIETLTANGVATEAVLTTQAGNTSMAVVTVAPDGEREFLIYRKGSADSTYAAEDVAADVIRSARILHVGSLWLGEPICGAAQRQRCGPRTKLARSSQSTSICGRPFGGASMRCARWRSKRRWRRTS